MPEQPNGITSAQRSAAKVAAIAFPISIGCVVFANYGLRSAVTGNPSWADKARIIAAAASTYRLAVIFDIAYCIAILALLVALYVVLSPVNRHLALLASCAKLFYGATALVMALSSLVTLQLVTDRTYATSLGSESFQALLRLNFAAAWDQYYVGLVFWSLSSTLFAWLWLKSRYIPTVLAGVGIVASVWGFFCAIAFLLNPAFGNTVHAMWFDMPLVLFYLALSGWLLFKGLRGSAALPHG